MTETLMWNNFTTEEREQLNKNGFLESASEGYESTYSITKQLIQDGKKHLLLKNIIKLDCPIRIIHGMKDNSVPWELTHTISNQIQSEGIIKIFIKDGEHGLSRKIDLDYLFFSINEIISTIEPI
jgi:esterase/lipase